MHPFDPHGWDYNFGFELIKQYFPAQSHLLRFGGKAVSLAACDRLRHVKRVFRVPRWWPVMERITVKKPTIFRSSAASPAEDWCSGKAGEHRSYVLQPGETFDPRDHAIPYIRQAFKPGIGIVIDIAWSELEQTVIGRVATGRLLPAEEQTEPLIGLVQGPKATVFYPTSGTDDSQGHALAWNLVTGELIHEHLGRHERREIKVLGPQLKILTLEMLHGAARMGIDFGIQLELRVNPFDPSYRWLVQMRPSPDAVRGHVTNVQGTIFGRTSTVSGAFDIEGELYVPKFKGFSFASECLRDDWFIANSRIVRGKILYVPGMIELPHGTPPAAWIRRLRQLQCKGIVARDSICANSAHNTFEPSGAEMLRELELLRQQTGTMRVDADTGQVLRNLGTVEGAPIRMVSDGLIGHLYAPSL